MVGGMRKLFVVALAALSLVAVQVQTASGHDPARAEAAKLKKCKNGANSKRCKCPKGSKLVKSHKKYRCKKKPAPANGNNTQGNNTNTNTNQTAPPAPPAGVQPQRDDAAFDAALSSTMLRRYEEGTYGYGRYAYNFLSDHQLLYCSYYYAGSTVEANRVGTWQVTEGYTVPGYPGYTAGKIHIVGSDFDVTMGAEMYNDKSNVATGNASNVFTQGAFGRYPGAATTNCSTIQ
jgi:hypothetical protein